MGRSSHRRKGARLAPRDLFVRALRFPFDLLFLALDHLRLSVWLLTQGGRRLSRRRSQPYGPCLKGPAMATALGEVRRCMMIRKYGNPFVFRMLFPGVCRLQDSTGRWFYSWGSVSARSPISPGRYVGTSLVALFLAAALAFCGMARLAPARLRGLQARLGLRAPPIATALPVPPRLPERARLLAEQGDGLAAGGRLQEAMAKYQDAVRADPLDAMAQIALGGVALQLGQRDSARLAFSAALNADPAAVPALRGMGRVHVEDGAMAAAATVLDRLLSQEPDDLQGLILRARVHAAVGEQDQADVLVSRACDRHPDAVEGWLAKGNLAMARGDLDTAKAAYERAQRCAPASVEARLGQLRVHAIRGQIEALPAAEALRVEQPDREDAALLVVDLLQQAGRIPEAVHLSEQTVQAQPTFMALRALLGTLYLRVGRLNDAYKLAARVLEERPGTTSAHLQIAAVLLDAKLPALAVEYCRKALAQNPLDRGAQQQLGVALLADGQFAAARDSLARIAARSPDNVDARLQLARCDMRAGRVDESRQELLALAEKYPASMAVQCALTELEWGQKNYAAALDYSRKAYRAAPRSLEAVNNYAILLAHNRQDLDEALVLGRQAFALAPDQPSVADTLGWIYLLRGQAQEALPLLAYAARRLPAAGDVLYHFAAALHAAGRVDEARRYLELALASAADFVGIEDAKALLARLPTAVPIP